MEWDWDVDAEQGPHAKAICTLEQHQVEWELSDGRLMVLDVHGRRTTDGSPHVRSTWILCPTDLMAWLGY